MSTYHVIDKALSINPEFEGPDTEKQLAWAYKFLKRRNFPNQITPSAIQSVKQDFCFRVMPNFRNRITNESSLVNMDETEIHLNCSPNTTINLFGERTIAIFVDGTSSMHLTHPVSVTMDETKLPLFLIFEGKPGCCIANLCQKFFRTAYMDVYRG